MTRDEIEAVAEAAAEKAVAKFMLTLGLATESPEAVLRAQALMQHLGDQYDACQTVKRHGLKTAVGTVVAALAAYGLLLVGLPKGH